MEGLSSQKSWAVADPIMSGMLAPVETEIEREGAAPAEL